MKDDKQTHITISATGKAISTALSVVEKIKYTFEGDLHQTNKIYSLEVVDVYEPKVEGMERIEDKKIIAALDIQLSKAEVDEENIGYQKPLLPDQKKQQKPPKPI